MRTNFAVIVDDNGKKKTYEFDCNDPWQAINFAEGYAEALCQQAVVDLLRPCVQSLDGFHWWNHRGDFTIKVVNKDGNVIKLSNCKELKCNN